MLKLYAQPGWGSTLVEAQLAWYGIPCEIEDVGNLFKSQDARERLAKVNPLAQLPTLVLPDGRIMTESAAITLHLADTAPAGKSLVPTAPGAERDRFLRWLVFLVASIYPTFTIGDDTSRWLSDAAAQKDLREPVGVVHLDGVPGPDGARGGEQRRIRPEGHGTYPRQGGPGPQRAEDLERVQKGHPQVDHDHGRAMQPDPQERDVRRGAARDRPRRDAGAPNQLHGLGALGHHGDGRRVGVA